MKDKDNKKICPKCGYDCFLEIDYKDERLINLFKKEIIYYTRNACYNCSHRWEEINSVEQMTRISDYVINLIMPIVLVIIGIIISVMGDIVLG